MCSQQATLKQNSSIWCFEPNDEKPKKQALYTKSVHVDSAKKKGFNGEYAYAGLLGARAKTKLADVPEANIKRLTVKQLCRRYYGLRIEKPLAARKLEENFRLAEIFLK